MHSTIQNCYHLLKTSSFFVRLCCFCFNFCNSNFLLRSIAVVDILCKTRIGRWMKKILRNLLSCLVNFCAFNAYLKSFYIYQSIATQVFVNELNKQQKKSHTLRIMNQQKNVYEKKSTDKIAAMAKWSVIACALKVVCVVWCCGILLHFCYSSHINGPNSMN